MNTDELLAQLVQFTGTEHYHRLNANFYLTDGALYLAENAGCFWLFDLYASHLAGRHHGTEFTVLKLTVKDSSADVTIEDGNDHVLAGQHVEYTDFPLQRMTLYCCWFGEGWVAMLPSEY